MAGVAKNWFTNRTNGIVMAVDSVDESFAKLVQVYPTGPTQNRMHNMPIAQYDTEFVRGFRPTTARDLGEESGPPQSFRQPANAAVWEEESDGTNS